MPDTPAKTEPTDRVLERVILGGDLSGLTAIEKVKYVVRVCRELGLNPYTQPFGFLKLQGKETLYPTKNCTDQLRSIHSISIEIISRSLVDGIYTVRARSSDPSGRKDEDEGTVPLPDNYKGEIRSNVMMKAVTKAKRRVTLSHCGLGFAPDESEVDSIPDGKTLPGPTPEELMLAQDLHADASSKPGIASAAAKEPSSPGSGQAAELSKPQLVGSAAEPFADILVKAENAEVRKLYLVACEAASRGRDVLVALYRGRTEKEKKQLEQIQEDLVGLYPTNPEGF
jgi:hypothetical protein